MQTVDRKTAIEIAKEEGVPVSEAYKLIVEPAPRLKNLGYEGKVAYRVISLVDGKQRADELRARPVRERFVRFFEIRRDLRVIGENNTFKGCHCELCGKHSLSHVFILEMDGRTFKAGGDCYAVLPYIDGSGDALSTLREERKSKVTGASPTLNIPHAAP